MLNYLYQKKNNSKELLSFQMNYLYDIIKIYFIF